MKLNFFKKNQVIIAVIGIMLIAAGYLNFTNNENKTGLLATGLLTDTEQMAAIGDATLVSTTPEENKSINEVNGAMLNNEENNNKVNNEEISSNTEEENKINVEENKIDSEENETNNNNNRIEQQTSANITTDEYFTKSRLERETMYSQMIESYQKILDKTTISEKQRTTAQNEITKINERKNAIMITENLIKTKGFEDIIIFINDSSVSVIIKAKKLETEQIAQIQNIITRELKAEIEDIHISNKE